MRLWARVVLGVTGALIVGAVWFKSAGNFLPGWLGGQEEIPVRIMTVRQRLAPVVVRAMGELLSVDQHDVTSRLAGKVTEVRFNIGDRVSANAHVATIQSDALAQRYAENGAAIRGARDELQSKTAQLRAAEEQLARARELHGRDLISRSEVERAATASEMARADAELAQAQLAQREAMQAELGALQSLTRVRTPIEGVVVRRWVEPGATITPSSAILTLAAADALRLVVRVAADYSSDIRLGMEAEIADPTTREKQAKGKVVHVEPSAKDNGRFLDVDIGLDSPGEQLRLGGQAEAMLRLDKSAAEIRLPRSIILSQGDKYYVYKLVDGRTSRQEVELGADDNSEVEVTRGLQDGDSVVVDQLRLIEPGVRVRIVNAK